MTGSTGIHAAKDWKKLWILCFLVTSAASALVATFVVLPLAFMAIQIDKPDRNRLAVDGILFASALLQGLLSGATFFMAFCGCCTAKGRKRVRYPIVLLRGDVKRARLLLIQTLCRNIRKLRDKKGKPDQLARNKHRAEKLHEDITVLKGLKPDDVTKAGLFADLDEHRVLSNPASSSQDRAMARLISHKALKGKLDTVRAKFSIVPDQKMVSHMKKTIKDKQPGHKAKKTADKPGQMKTGNRPAENIGKTQTQTDSTVENTEQMSDVIAEQSSSRGESSVSGVVEEGEIRPNTDKAKASSESPITVEIDVSTRNSESESEEDEEEENSEEEMEDDADSEMEEIPNPMTESTTQSQVNLSESRETNDQLSTKRTEPSTAKRKGPRKAACDAEEDEDEEEKEETTVTEGDDMFLREGDPDPEEDTDGRKVAPDSGGGLGVPLVARALPGESLFIGSLSGGRRGKHVKKGKFEKRTGKRPMERCRKSGETILVRLPSTPPPVLGSQTRGSSRVQARLRHHPDHGSWRHLSSDLHIRTPQGGWVEPPGPGNPSLYRPRDTNRTKWHESKVIEVETFRLPFKEASQSRKTCVNTRQVHWDLCRQNCHISNADMPIEARMLGIWVEMPGGACKACQGNKCTKFSQQEAGAGFLFLGRLLSLSGDDKPSSGGGGSKSGGASSGGSNSGSSMSNKQCKCGHTYAQHA
uniref:Uncharacterized protein n=1 Tax=Branchiostoma floridae TaxID=7739 RepID=C3YNS9_BRAFL|eukprot:XP_002602027.1 hypothetical protein BRAFLDRAFT_82616 [Branchiostoma floridae]